VPGTLRLAPIALAIALAATAVAVSSVHGERAPAAALGTRTEPAATVCLPDASPASLARLFVGEPAGIVGADYQRTIRLPNGDVLWTFQDAEVRRPDGSTTTVHNIAMVQQSACFHVLIGGTPSNPLPWLFAADTAQYFRWFWPLGATVGSDGRVYVFAAEMTERGDSYLTEVVPVGTHVAAFDPDSWTVEWYGRPADGGASLYGWSIASDDDWAYLFAQCHRQFGFDEYALVLAHDRSCASRVTVARVPVGRPLDPPRYWDGRRWQADPARAAPIIEMQGRLANPTQFVFHDNHWLAITKVGDWWGDRILIEQSRRATGPFEIIEERRPAAKCIRDCNTYFASWVPAIDANSLYAGLSHNRWDGVATAVYRPTFTQVSTPSFAPSPAARCSQGHCD